MNEALSQMVSCSVVVRDRKTTRDEWKKECQVARLSARMLNSLMDEQYRKMVIQRDEEILSYGQSSVDPMQYILDKIGAIK